MRKNLSVGRNDPCPCGSGKKFKRCCENRQRQANLQNRVIVIALVSLLAGAVLVAVFSATRTSSSAGPRQVWSAEHGHYHDVQ